MHLMAVMMVLQIGAYVRLIMSEVVWCVVTIVTREMIPIVG